MKPPNWTAADYGLPPDTKLPEFSLYMSPPGTCELLREVYRQVQPEIVIEFGAGVSTLVFKDLTGFRPVIRYSIENDKKIAYDLRAYHAPIENGWYSREALRELGVWKDCRLLAFVDGPSTALSGPRGRGPAMLLIDELFPNWSGAILLDDAQRLGEAADFREWRILHPEAEAFLLPVSSKPDDPEYVKSKRIGVLVRGVKLALLFRLEEGVWKLGSGSVVHIDGADRKKNLHEETQTESDL